MQRDPGSDGARRSRRRLWLLAVGLTLTSFAAVAIPVWLIMPFKLQTPGTLELSYALRRVTPVASIVAAIATLALMVRLWRGGRWWGRAFGALLCAVSLFVAWFAQHNHFEWMFSPVAKAGFVAGDTADFVEPSDMVFAVTEAGDAAAYPVRQIAFHHVVQDTVGGVSVVVTY